ncbi:MAG: hypothetical protein H7Z75_20270, partial [Ferruginibacter sp.]|nr:hypothetical protein [Cytophagales bacterium]
KEMIALLIFIVGQVTVSLAVGRIGGKRVNYLFYNLSPVFFALLVAVYYPVIGWKITDLIHPRPEGETWRCGTEMIGPVFGPSFLGVPIVLYLQKWITRLNLPKQA